MKTKSSKATSRIDMRPICANLTALIMKVEKVKQPSHFLLCYRGALLSARDNARSAGVSCSATRPDWPPPRKNGRP